MKALHLASIAAKMFTQQERCDKQIPRDSTLVLWYASCTDVEWNLENAY